MAIQAGITPLIGPNIAWTNFLKDVASLTGHSPTRGIDASGLTLKHYTKFLSSIGEFRSGKAQHPYQSSDDLLDHLSFGFLIWGSSTLVSIIYERTDLKITSAKIKGGRAAVVSGTLKDWKQAVINCLQPPSSRDSRWIFNRVSDGFYKLGLGYIWNDYRQKSDGDTFLLEYQK